MNKKTPTKKPSSVMARLRASDEALRKEGGARKCYRHSGEVMRALNHLQEHYDDNATNIVGRAVLELHARTFPQNSTPD